MQPAEPLHVVRDGQYAGKLAGGAIAIGNFDGVHRGHQAVIAKACEFAKANEAACGVMTFEPHPRTVFQPDSALFRLAPEPVKLKLLQAAGVDGVVIAGFDRDFAAKTAEQFVDDLLVGLLDVSAVVVGQDFRFGKGREGDVAMLRDFGLAKKFEVIAVGPEGAGDLVFSSSAVRKQLGEGDIDAAANVLGYRWFFEAEVVHGEKRGRDLGYPTANMALEKDCGLRQGVYAVRALIDGEHVGGVASFGVRPQFDNGAPLFESYFFDFSGDLYGKTIAVTPLAFLRGEAKFDSVDDLVRQMDADADAARDIVARLKSDDPVSDFAMARALRDLKLA
ncbi:bifunctional riboflavin kinase/FAD synthetase [Tepidamorphus sp. 3E244]|uniref:bifunctional riboflavin kinase/FAD synthetase n=1 Tax=Tepidamorphus sp. 3E244 TaxID=3385498 RepID=UPI0038FC263F